MKTENLLMRETAKEYNFNDGFVGAIIGVVGVVIFVIVVGLVAIPIVGDIINDALAAPYTSGINGTSLTIFQQLPTFMSISVLLMVVGVAIVAYAGNRTR